MNLYRYTDKSMNMRRSFSLALSIVILCVLFCNGCSDINSKFGTKIILTTGFDDNEIFRIEKLSCMMPEAMVYLTNTKNLYENAYGKQILDTSYKGITFEDSIKETVLARLARIKALNLISLERGISLSEHEEMQCRKAAEEYFDSLNDKEKELLGVDSRLICEMYREYTLANRVYEDLISDINPEISDDEARTITVKYIFIKTCSADENGNRVPYSQQAKTEAYERIKEASGRAEKGEDFAALIAEYNEDEASVCSFGKGMQESAFEEAAFNLGTDEISGIVETVNGYYIIKCISTFDKDQTDRNKLLIMEKRKKEVFDREYTHYVDNLTKNINEPLWQSVGFIDDGEVSTDSFFEVYYRYFDVQGT